MKSDFLKTLECPYCGSSFETKEVYCEEEGEIVDGSVSCACAGEYPILEGILNLKLDASQGYILDMLKKRKKRARRGCLALMLKENPERILYLSSFLKSKGFLGRKLGDALWAFNTIWTAARNRKYFSTSKTFFDLLGNDAAGVYFKHRFSSQSLWSAYPIIPSLKMNSTRVLDLCCGMGHGSFVISTHVKPKELVCVDQEFRSLYFARKFFVSNAHLLCADVNYGLPFKSSIFDSVLMIDAYNYVKSHAHLAKELCRILSAKGFLFLFHLHNSLVQNGASYYSMSPQAWLNLFKDTDLRLEPYPENELVRKLLEETFELREKYTANELNAAAAISVLGSRNRNPPAPSYPSEIFRETGKLIVNPLYVVHRKSTGDISLRKVGPSSLSPREKNSLAYGSLPDEIILDERLTKFLKRGRALDTFSIRPNHEEAKEIRTLMKRFVLLNSPDKYAQ